jgi:chromate transport protein ChrA
MTPNETTTSAVAAANAASSSQLKQIALSFLRLGTIAFGGTYRDDGRGVRQAPCMGVARGFSRHAGRVQSRPRTEFDRDGHSYRPSASRLERARHRRRLLHCSRHDDRHGLRVGLRDVRITASGAEHHVRREAGDNSGGAAGPVGLARGAVKNAFLATIGALATGAALAGGNVLVILLAAGAIAVVRAWLQHRPASFSPAGLPMTKSLLASAAPLAVAIPIGLWELFLIFLKFGAVIFGSGYVLLAFLQADLVNRLHWLTQAQLLDAVAIGQVTPGPVFTTATFIGYMLAGVPGAVVATVGIFLPGFLFVAASRPLIPRIRGSKIAGAFLDGVNVGAVALMIAVSLQLGRAAVVDLLTGGIAALSAVILIFLRINSAWLIFAGALIGFARMSWFAG